MTTQSTSPRGNVGCFGRLIQFALIAFVAILALSFISGLLNPSGRKQISSTDAWSTRVASSTAQARQTAGSTPEATATPAKTLDELKAEAVAIEYKDLYRNIESHTSKVLHATGRVVQVTKQTSLFADDYITFRVNITKDEYGNYSDTVWLEYHGTDRFLEDDTIEFWATVDGLYTYQSVMGAQVELPKLTAIDIVLIAE